MNDASEVARLRAENDRLTQPWQSVCIFVSKPAKRTVAKAASWVLHCAPSVSLPRPECQQNQTSIAGFAFSRQTQSLTWLNRNDACKGLPLACRSNQSTHFAMASLVATDRSPDGQCCVHQLIGQSTRRQAQQIGPVFGHIEPATLIEAEQLSLASSKSAALSLWEACCLRMAGQRASASRHPSPPGWLHKGRTGALPPSAHAWPQLLIP